MTLYREQFHKTMDRVSRVVNAPFVGRIKKPKPMPDAGMDVDEMEPPLIPPEENILRRCDTRCLLMTTRDLQLEFSENQISPRLVFDHPTIESISQHLCDQEDEAWEPSLREAVGFRPALAGGWFRSESEQAQPFTQLVIPPEEDMFSGGLSKAALAALQGGLYETAAPTRYFRETDGMECVLLPKASVWIGSGVSDVDALPMEKPCHRVDISSFLIDIEPVSIGAYARFLNLARPPPDALQDWILLLDGDERDCHLPLQQTDVGVFEAKPGVPLSWPMIMVSWYGANAYSLWANSRDWRSYRSTSQSFLPTEAQWEYAARGANPAVYPWGNAPAKPGMLNVCWNMEAHDPTSHTSIPLQKFPLVPVNVELGMSPFGLRHMAGNVLNWCKDTYDPHFYGSFESSKPDAWNPAEDSLKCEKGGNWVEPPEAARSSWRRGRAAGAMGRCLGFRCVGIAAEARRSDPDEDSTTAASGSDEN